MIPDTTNSCLINTQGCRHTTCAPVYRASVIVTKVFQECGAHCEQVEINWSSLYKHNQALLMRIAGNVTGAFMQA